MIATAFAVCYTGAKPVFVDSEEATWNIDPAKIEEKITPRTKVILPVHIWGHPCEMDVINQLANKYDLTVLEDAAEAHGARYKGVKCGSLGDIAAFSFFANKVATTGEGGMVVTNNDKLAEKCRYFKNMCFPLDGNRSYKHDDIGFNYRMSNIHAAIGLAQVEKLDYYVAKRKEINSWYRKYLNIDGVSFQSELTECENVYWMNSILIDPDVVNITRDKLITALKQKGVDTRLFFVGMNKQPALVEYGCECEGDYPVSDKLTKNGFYLPSASSLIESEVKSICEIFIEILKND
jgi:perosamine synthetase